MKERKKERRIRAQQNNVQSLNHELQQDAHQDVCTNKNEMNEFGYKYSNGFSSFFLTLDWIVFELPLIKSNDLNDLVQSAYKLHTMCVRMFIHITKKEKNIFCIDIVP